METRYELRLDTEKDVSIFELRISQDWMNERTFELNVVFEKFPVRGKLSCKA